MIRNETDAAVDKEYVTKVLSYIHTLATGIFSYKKSTSIWWKLWSLHQAMSTLSILIANALYPFFEDTNQLEDVTWITAIILSCTMILVVQYIASQFTENWDNLKEILKQDFVSSLDVSGDLGRNERVKNLKTLFQQKRVRWLYFFTGQAFVIALCIVLWQYAQMNIDIHEPFNYLSHFPGIRRVNTRHTFLFICLVQWSLIISMIVPIMMISLFVIVIAIEIKNKAVILDESLKSLTDHVHHTVTQIREYELKIGESKQPRVRELGQRKAQKEKRECIQQFEETLKICIKHHQTLLRAIKFLKPLLNNYFTVTLSCYVVLMIACGFIVIIWSKELSYNSQMIRFFMLFSTLTFQMGLKCYIAQVFQNVNDTIAEQVYSLPWYELPPLNRKNVYIFLCQAQAPVNFYAFKTFRISTYFFPTILNFVYTNTVNLLTIKEKYHRI